MLERAASGALTATVLLASALLAARGWTAEIDPRPLRWHLDAPARDESGLAAVAVSETAVAIGDRRGVRVRNGRGPWRSHAVRGAVSDLAFDPRGALWIASESGLHRLDAGRLTAISPGAGAGRAALRVASDAHALAVITETGVFWTGGDEVWERVEGSFGPPPAFGLAFADGTLWVAAPRGLFRVPPRANGIAPRAEPVALPSGLRPTLDVWSDGTRVLALGVDRLAFRSHAQADWQASRPVLPPGAVARRVAASRGRLWIATDRGLVSAADAQGPWQRDGGAAGNTPIGGLAVEGGRVLLAAARGLWVGAPEEPGEVPPVRSCEPAVEALHREALRFIGLDLTSVGRLGQGVHERGWWPLMTLRADAEHGRDRGSDHDEAFLSGSTRYLHDRDHGENDEVAVTLTLTWDFGDVVYNPEEIDVSAERRRLIELRDDVLDEVNQVYFERRRALAAAARSPDRADAELARVRAEELAAGLDGWTGGWFGAQLRACPPVRP